MMILKSKPLSDAGWKDVTSRHKLKDNGLLKLLEKLKRLSDDEHDEATRMLDEACKLATQLKKDKAVAAAPAAAKYIGELLAAAESAQRDVGKARAEHAKVQKAKADAERKAAEAAASKDDDDDDESPEILTTKLKPLLKMVGKGESLHALVARSGKKVVVMLSRKPIPMARRKLLSEQLGGGSTKFYPGHCSNEAGNTTFVLHAEVAGMAKLIKLALLEQTGLRMNRIKCRGDDGDDHDDDGDASGEGAADGEATAEDAGEDAGRVKLAVPRTLPLQPMEPPEDLGEATVEHAPVVWHGTRGILGHNIEALKRAISQEYAAEDPSLLAEIDRHVKRVDVILEKLDSRLADTLERANDTADDDEHAQAVAAAREVLAQYLDFVESEPLIDHIDRNPFGVDTRARKVITDSLVHMGRSLAHAATTPRRLRVAGATAGNR